MKTLPRLTLCAAVLATCIGCDQTTKHIATSALKGGRAFSYFGDLFRLQYAENAGAFLSLGGGLDPELRFWLLTVLVGAFLVGVLIYALTATALSPMKVAAISLMTGGGISNWIDRVHRHGVVVDFLNLGIGDLRTGIFNIADLAIIAGALIMLVHKGRSPPSVKRLPA